MKRIAILDVAAITEPEFAQFGPAVDLIGAWLGPHLPGVELVGFNIWNGQALPDVGDFEGFILPGSEKGVYDDTPWMAPLARTLLDIRAAGRPIMGICFGHQMMAHVYGGRAEKADKGFCLGLRAFEGADGGTILAQVSHQDQVVEMPPEARVTVSAEYCPVAALEYDFPAMSTQFHPEYFPAYIAAIADVLEGDLIGAEEARAARESVADDPVPRDLFAKEVAAFFRRHL